MELWQQLLMTGMLIGMLFFIWPGVKASIERSKQSQEKHWGTFGIIVLALIAFIALMIVSLQ